MLRVSVCAGPQGLTGSNKSSGRMPGGTSCGSDAGHSLGCCACWVHPRALGAVSVSLPCDDERGRYCVWARRVWASSSVG